MSQKVTLLVPTMNRPGFIERLLRYYFNRQFKGVILIADSSNGESLEHGRKLASMYASVLNLQYQEYPGMSNVACITAMLDVVSTPFVAYVADDDFIIPAAMDECVTFLESHAEYVAAHGTGTIVKMPSASPVGDPIAATYYKQSVLLGESACARLETYLQGDAQPLFALFRINEMRYMFKCEREIRENSVSGELLPASLSAISGKIAGIDQLYLVRTDHSARSSSASILDRILSPIWQSSIRVYLQRVTDGIAAQDRLDRSSAEAHAKRLVLEYLSRSVSRGLPTEVGLQSYLRRTLSLVPAVRSLWQATRTRLPGAAHRMTLPSLVRPGSRDRDEFLHVLDALRGKRLNMPAMPNM